MTLGRGIRRVATLYEGVASVLDEVDIQNSETPGSTFDRRLYISLFAAILTLIHVQPATYGCSLAYYS